MKIEEQKQFVDRIKAQLKDYLKSEERKPGAHVSDLLFPRKTFWRKIREMPLTDAEMGYFLAGKGHHAILQSLLGAPQFKEAEVEWQGINGTIDFWEDVPIEIKTTRAMTFHVSSRIPDHWLEQLGMYVAMVHPNSTKGVGVLLIFYLGIRSEGNVPALKAHRVTYENLDAVREKMKLTNILLMDAVSNSNPAMLPYCPDWLCKPEKCQYYNPCKVKPEYAWGTQKLE